MLVTTPAHAAGTVDVSVATPGGVATASNAYAYLAPSVSIGDVAHAEGNTGTTPFVFPVTLSYSTPSVVQVDYIAMSGSAQAGSDFVPTSGTLSFAPGTVTQTITVPVFGDSIRESNKTFAVVLSAPANATIVRGSGAGTIVDDDLDGAPVPVLSEWALVILAMSLAWIALKSRT